MTDETHYYIARRTFASFLSTASSWVKSHHDDRGPVPRLHQDLQVHRIM